jgi:hypothetical protein
VTENLPALLGRLQSACAVLDGEARSQAYTLSAEAHHVAASILFKVGDQGLGWLAADRSMQAARASEDPVTVASSARIVTHALMGSKHYKAATDTASTLAARFDQDVSVHDPESPADAIIVAPATYNTINKWAQGISDTYALGILAETTALGVPIVVLPFVNSALAARAPFRRSAEDLRSEGIHILLGPGGVEPHEPHTGGELIAGYPWHLALTEVERLVTPANHR